MPRRWGNRHPSALGKRVPDVWVDVWADIKRHDRRGLRRRRDLLRGPAADDDAARVHGGVLLHVLLQPGGGARRHRRRPAQHRRRDDAAGARDPAAGRAAATGQPAPVGARATPPEAVARGPRACSPARGPTAPSGSSTWLDDDGGSARLVAGHGIGVEGELADAASSRSRCGRRSHRGDGRPSPGSPSSCPGSPAAGRARSGRTTCTPPSSFRSPWPAGNGPSARAVLGTSPHLQLDDDVPDVPHARCRAGRGRRRGRAGGRGGAPPRRGAAGRPARAQFFTDVAVTLQRAVLGPTVLPDGFAVHYEPATGTLEVGGDWYDVVDLPDGSTASSSATSSAGDSPPPRSWVSSAAPVARCCWRAARRRTCCRHWTGSPRSFPAPP